MNFFITGTDTCVGKTYFSSLLIRGLRARGIDSVGMKPISCGATNDDALALAEASGGTVSAEEINPVWMRVPASPFTASVVENQIIDTDAVLAAYRSLRARRASVIVEGVGGWMVPIRPDYYVADLATEMDLPVIVVVDNKLGALNHALLTLDNIQRRGLRCPGVVFNNRAPADDIAATTNRAILETLAPVPILWEIARDQDELDAGRLVAAGA